MNDTNSTTGVVSTNIVSHNSNSNINSIPITEEEYKVTNSVKITRSLISRPYSYKTRRESNIDLKKKKFELSISEYDNDELSDEKSNLFNQKEPQKIPLYSTKHNDSLLCVEPGSFQNSSKNNHTFIENSHFELENINEISFIKNKRKNDVSVMDHNYDNINGLHSSSNEMEETPIELLINKEKLQNIKRYADKYEKKNEEREGHYTKTKSNELQFPSIDFDNSKNVSVNYSKTLVVHSKSKNNQISSEIPDGCGFKSHQMEEDSLLIPKHSLGD